MGLHKQWREISNGVRSARKAKARSSPVPGGPTTRSAFGRQGVSTTLPCNPPRVIRS